MAVPKRYCPACYAINDWLAERCTVCDCALQTEESYDERLIWALDHPDTSVAVIAAQVLADRRAKDAVEPLIRLLGSKDPYRAAAAAASLTAFADDPRAKAAVGVARTHPSVLVRRAVSPSSKPADRA